MAANKIFNFGPVALSATLTTNILNPPVTSGGVGCGTPNTYVVIKHVRIVNKTAGPVTCSFWKGLTGGNAAGTEIWGQGLSVSASSFIDIFGLFRFDVADFLVGGASAGTSLSIEGEGEIGIA